MSFLTYRDVNFNVNGQSIFCDRLTLNQEANLSQPFMVDERVNTRTIVNSPKNTQLSLTYFLTGKCPLKDYTLTNHKFPISGRINSNLQFNQGYLQTYRLVGRPNNPISISVDILVTDEVSGILSNITPVAPPSDLLVWNYNDSSFSNNSLNIISYEWNFQNEINPVYYYGQTGKSFINPDGVNIGPKQITTNIVSDSEDLILGFSGNPFSIDFTCRHPSQNITEIYSCSGMIDRKNFSISSNDVSATTYTITQSHLNEFPVIYSVNTNTYPANEYITIRSENLTNGYFSNNKNFSLIEKVVLGDRTLKFIPARGTVYDTITGYIPNDAINGELQVQTSKGTIFYPSKINLNFSGIGVSGFYPQTGNYHDLITISGSNFFRISHVLFNNVPANFNVYNTTGQYHQLIANVPDNAILGKITVLSSLRNKSGISTGIFYPIPEITGFSPSTGIWGSQIVLGGKNFSGITNVYFNEARSLNFTVNSTSVITVRTPPTGAGFAKGYIKISGFQGMNGYSKSIYHPLVLISGISTISGGIDNDLKITGCFDSGYLYFSGGGFKVAFGNTDTFFYKSGDFLLSGLIPTGFFDGQYISLYEPDGVTKYPSFTGRFQQVGPKPVIETINGQTSFSIATYASQTLNLGGKYFKDFFGLPYYILISGSGSQYTYSTNSFTGNTLGTQISIPNFRITGASGLFDIYVANYAGTGSLKAKVDPNNSNLKTGLFAVNGIDLVLGSSMAQYPRLKPSSFPPIPDDYRMYTWPAGGNQVLNVSHGLIGYAQDNNISSFSCTPFFPSVNDTFYNPPTSPNTLNSGWVTATFPVPINLSYIYIGQNSNIPIDAYPQFVSYDYPLGFVAIQKRVNNGYQTLPIPSVAGQILLAQTGMFQAFDNNGTIVYSTGISFINSTYTLTGTIPNIRMIKLFRIGPPTRYLAFSQISAY